MSAIKPFSAVLYNSKKIKDFSKVVCPPYDVISAEAQQSLHNLSPYNFTHMDLGADRSGDDKAHNKYTRAKEYLDDWLEKGILVQDDKPAVYFYKQEYKIKGQKYSRLGFISLMEMKDPEESKVFPHENTHAHAVEDRLKLTLSLNSQLSCIFVCYADQQKKVEKIFQKNVFPDKPILDVEDDDKVRHRLWRLDVPELIAEINGSIEGQNLFIADGHHRYKVANDYRRLKREKKSNDKSLEPFNYVMTYFTNMDSRDLQIFPIHRILKNFPADITFLEEYFRIDKIRNKNDLQIFLGRAGRNEQAFGLVTKDGFEVLRLKNKSLIDEIVKEGSREYKNLDATILKYFIFDKIGIKSEDITYSKDFDEAVELVHSHQAQASFILNPVQISQLKAIALNGEKMPPKTTYFYPKVLSGLTVYKMD